MDQTGPTAPSPQPAASFQPDISSFPVPSATAQSSSPPPSSSGSSSQQAPSRGSSPTPSRTVKHWPWRPNVYARLKIRGQIFPVKLAEVTSTPPPDHPNDFGGDDWYDARFWACVYIDELDYCWWAFTVAIIILDEILRHPIHEDALAPATAEIKDLVDALRALRDAVASDENYGGSRLWLPLSSGETLDEVISIPHVCWPHGDTFGDVFHFSRNPGLWKSELNALILNAHDMCKNLHASSELLYFGDLPQEPMSRVEAYLKSGGQTFATELQQDMKFFIYTMELVMSQQEQRQFEAATLTRTRNTVPEIVAAGAYGQIFKFTHPYWGDLAVKEPLPRNVPEQLGNNELRSHFGILGHTNILPVVAWASRESGTVVAMQWAENGSLDKFLARNPDSSRPLLLVSIATALRQLHENNRLHGDLHMGNIVVSKDGEAFLCDFGLSKTVNGRNAQDVAASGTVEGGAPIYTAPELYEPGARRTFASEVFAFGMIIFHVYSDMRPFVRMANNQVAPHDAAVIKAIANGARPTRDQVTRDDFSDDMWNLVQDCWKQNPAHRPSMDQVVQRMIPIVPILDKFRFLARAMPIELTLFRAGDVALDDAMEAHERSAELRWTLSRMEHFGLKKFFTDHIDGRDGILLATVEALLSSQAIDEKDFDLGVALRLYKITHFPDSDFPD